MWYILLSILAVWAVLTFWAQAKGKAKLVMLGNTTAAKHILIVYDPDPFYNLDEQVCNSFAKGLLTDSTCITIATTAAAEKLTGTAYSLYVFCANTYNWQPDRAVSNFIKMHPHLNNRPVIAVTLGAGSTAASKKTLEKIIHKKEALLVDSRSFWLLRPNDEQRMKERNVTAALLQVTAWAKEISKRIQQW